METQCVCCEVGTGLINISQKLRLERDHAEGSCSCIFIHVSYFLFVCSFGRCPMKEGIQTMSYPENGCTASGLAEEHPEAFVLQSQPAESSSTQ